MFDFGLLSKNNKAISDLGFGSRYSGPGIYRLRADKLNVSRGMSGWLKADEARWHPQGGGMSVCGFVFSGRRVSCYWLGVPLGDCGVQRTGAKVVMAWQVLACMSHSLCKLLKAV